jgi:hypothetical protein
MCACTHSRLHLRTRACAHTPIICTRACARAHACTHADRGNHTRALLFSHCLNSRLCAVGSHPDRMRRCGHNGRKIRSGTLCVVVLPTVADAFRPTVPTANRVR